MIFCAHAHGKVSSHAVKPDLNNEYQEVSGGWEPLDRTSWGKDFCPLYLYLKV